MPETLIPIVAIIGGAEGSEDVAIGAIIGAPFLLATIAMALVGISALIFQGRREQGTRADGPRRDARPRPDLLPRLLRRSGSLLGLGRPRGAPHPARDRLRRRLRRLRARDAARRRRGPGGGHDRPALPRPHPRRRARRAATIVIQLVVGLGAIVGGAHLFVEELITSPRTSGSSRWCSRWCSRRWRPSCPRRRTASSGSSDGKDSLALGNITGAMVFQSTIPIAVGLALTDWDLDQLRGRLRRPRPRRRRDRLLGAAPARPLRAAADRDLVGALRRLHRLRGARLSAASELRERRSARRRRASSATPSRSPRRSCRRGR